MSCNNKVYSILSFKMRLNWLVGLSFLMPSWAFYPALLLGIYIAGDDIYQHHRQVFEFNPCYHSPVHNFYGKYLYKYRIVRFLNKVVSWLFHNPLILAILIGIIIVIYVMT